MSQPDPPPPPDPADPPREETQPRLQVGGSVGGDVAGGDLHKTTTAGRDVVGGDVVSSTHIGFGVEAVQRLLVTVGALVFVTAFCFFSSGFVLGGVALTALNREVASSPEAAASFAAQLAALQNLPPGQTATFSFTEDEISSYFRFVVAPNLGVLDITDGKVRLLNDGRLVVGGQAGALGGVEFAATFAVTEAIGQPLDLNAAAVKLLPTRGTPFGWVLVPTRALGGVERAFNDLFGNVQILDTAANDAGDGWTVTVLGH